MDEDELVSRLHQSCSGKKYKNGGLDLKHFKQLSVIFYKHAINTPSDLKVVRKQICDAIRYPSIADPAINLDIIYELFPRVDTPPFYLENTIFDPTPNKNLPRPKASKKHQSPVLTTAPNTTDELTKAKIKAKLKSSVKAKPFVPLEPKTIKLKSADKRKQILDRIRARKMGKLT